MPPRPRSASRKSASWSRSSSRDANSPAATSKATPPLPPTEIRPKCGEFFDFSSKYLPGGSEEITPALLLPEQTRELQELARRVHETLRLRAYSRTDFILADDGPIILEVNTLPGMTETSLIPQAAACIGMSYRDLVTAILKASWDHD